MVPTQSRVGLVVLQMMSLLPVAINWHLLETISLTIAGNLLASCHSFMESLELRKLVKAARSEYEVIVKQVEHCVVNERNLNLQSAIY